MYVVEGVLNTDRFMQYVNGMAGGACFALAIMPYAIPILDAVFRNDDVA